VKGTPIGPDLIQTEAFDLPPQPVERPTANVGSDAYDMGRRFGRALASALREGFYRGLDPNHHWRDPVSGKYVPKEKDDDDHR